MIRKRDGKWYLYTKDGSKVLGGPYDTRTEAVDREKQVQYFKHKGGESMVMKSKSKIITEKAPKGRKPTAKEMGVILKLDALKVHEDEKAMIDSFGDWAGGKVSSCIEILSGKEGIDDPAPLCAWMKDQWSGSTDWRGEESKAKESDSGEEVTTQEHYDESAMVAASPMVPMGVYSFDDLDTAEAAQHMAMSVEKMLHQFQQMMVNALWDSQLKEKGMVLLNLVVQLQDRLAISAGDETAMVAGSEVAEAETIKARVKRAIAALDDVLENSEKSLPQSIILQVKGLRETFKRKWKDIETVGEVSNTNTQETNTETIKIGESFEGAEVVTVAEAAGVDPSFIYMDVVPIRPGWGNSKDNNYYSAEMLKENAAKLLGAKMYETDHKPGEKNNRTWVSTIVEAGTRFNDGGAPIVRVGVHDPNFAERVRNLQEMGQLNKLQCSILAEAIAFKGQFSQDGRTGKNIKEIKAGNIDVDWVTRAGAGGHAVAIAESADGTTSQNDSQSQEEVKTMLEKAKVEELVNASKLHPKIKVRLIAGQYETEAQVKEAIDTEVEIIKEITASGQVTNLGESQPAGEKIVPMSEADYQKMLDDIDARHGLAVRV